MIIMGKTNYNHSIIQDDNLRIPLAVIDPIIGTNPFIYGHSVVSTCLDMYQKQHIRKCTHDPEIYVIKKCLSFILLVCAVMVGLWLCIL